jgi:hypothetical protein
MYRPLTDELASLHRYKCTRPIDSRILTQLQEWLTFGSRTGRNAG